ncbi:MAG: NapC/NirT family cytochrome c [Anaerolineae bacterium]
MGRFKRLWARLRAIPPRAYAFGLVGVVIIALAMGAGFWAWDYASSPVFCGTTCHTMPPHYESYLNSSHARVNCVECHIGRTSFGVEFTRKAVDAQFVVSYLTGNYKYPIYVNNLQPATESCEKCHWPEKFSNDKIVNVTHYATDEKNTPTTTTLVMHVGGGTSRQGLGLGIHWHIENPIVFYYADNQQQQIPYIEVTNKDGSKTVYKDLSTPLTPEEIAKLPKRQMDCIDCHNRTSHNFLSPTDALDSAMQNKQIDPNIPFIKQKGIELLTPLYKTPQEATQAIGALEKYYQDSQAAYYAQNKSAVQNAVKALQDLYPTLHYPDQGLDWTIHPNNLGHKDWPGCFRCHDGKHFTADGSKAIRLECNVCHSLPEVTTPDGPAPAISLAPNQEPASHQTTTWLAEHRNTFDASCQQCHDTRNAGGKDNSSFCSNSACHGSNWKYVGLNAPALAKLLNQPAGPKSQPGATPVKIPHPINGNPDCQICHGPDSKVLPYPADHQGRANTTCTACHPPSISPAQPAPVVTGPPSIPHDLAGRNECLGCHGSGMASVPQVPQFHKDYQFPNTGCLNCHKSGPATQSTPVAGATPTASAGGPPNQPADHAGRTVCLACHQTGVGGAPTAPADHAGRTDDTCTACHKPR